MMSSIGPWRAVSAATMLIIPLVLAGARAGAQANGSIAGVVFDQAMKVGLEGAEVHVVGTKLRTIFGPTGRYEPRVIIIRTHRGKE